mmetsp:Transcript_25999/g.66303  ORF Transcript_25999/g.66303 Transcript_25999/m.66303 type:complete len:253 (+) Transcript_25999:696-1454(+)
MRAFFKTSRASGSTMSRRFGKPRAAKGGDTSGRPFDAWSFAWTLSMHHSTRVQCWPATLVGPRKMPGETSVNGIAKADSTLGCNSTGSRPGGDGIDPPFASASLRGEPVASDAAMANATPGGSGSPGGKSTKSSASDDNFPQSWESGAAVEGGEGAVFCLRGSGPSGSRMGGGSRDSGVPEEQLRGEEVDVVEVPAVAPSNGEHTASNVAKGHADHGLASAVAAMAARDDHALFSTNRAAAAACQSAVACSF